MLRLSRWVAVVAILLSASTVAFAQRPAGGQPGGRTGGFGGGFGGPGGGSPLTYVTNEAVQKELGLKEEQISKLKALGEEVREDMRGAFTGFGGGQNQTDEERAKQREKTAEAMKKVNDKVKPKLVEILDATQRERLQQITWQAAGPQAYQDADVIAALKVSKDQQEKLASVSKEYGEKTRALFGQGGGGGGGGGDEARTKMRELGESRDKALAEVLTADQQEAFAKLKGKTFDVAQLRGGFGGGRGGPGGAGGANPSGRPTRRPAEGDKKAESKKADSK